MSSGRGVKDPDERGRLIREVAPYLDLGIRLAVTVLAGIGVGFWLDRRLGTQPILLLVGGVMGILVAGYHFWRTVGGGGR